MNLDKTLIASVTFTAIMGAFMKIVAKRLDEPKDILWSAGTSVAAAYIAYLIGEAFYLTETHLLILVWTGAYMGREFAEIIVDAVKEVLDNKLHKI